MDTPSYPAHPVVWMERKSRPHASRGGRPPINEHLVDSCGLLSPTLDDHILTQPKFVRENQKGHERYVLGQSLGHDLFELPASSIVA